MCKWWCPAWCPFSSIWNAAKFCPMMLKEEKNVCSIVFIYIRCNFGHTVLSGSNEEHQLPIVWMKGSVESEGKVEVKQCWLLGSCRSKLELFPTEPEQGTFVCSQTPHGDGSPFVESKVQPLEDCNAVLILRMPFTSMSSLWLWICWQLLASTKP